MDPAIHPFRVEIPDAALEDLKQRLALTRFPDAETVEDWSQGLPLSYARELVDYWSGSYDWRRAEAAINQWPGFRTELNDIDIHFVHVRSRHSQARPLILTHGWPGSIFEYLPLIPALTDPTQHGGTPEQAFHVVIPSLPGYGFSGKPTTPGTSVEAIATMWRQLMQRLGYEQFLAHGGDWGSVVTHALALHHSDACCAAHVTLPVLQPDPATLDAPNADEIDALGAFQYYEQWGSGYSRQQSTRPQTLGYGLADSPVGQLCWIVEKFAEWTDCEVNADRHPENAISRDTLLDNVSLYWLTNSGASAARLYWESFNSPNISPIATPMGVSVFPKEIFRCSERWAQRRYQQLSYFNNKIARGGHFAALEQPELLLAEIHAWLAALTESEVALP